MNLNSTRYLVEAISRSELHLDNSYCIFNPYSYLNIVRVNESTRRYLDEKNRETQPTANFVSELFNFCKGNVRNWSYGQKHFDKLFNVGQYDPNSSGKIYGNILLDRFPFIVDHMRIEQIIELLSRHAMLFGYNYVAHDISRRYELDGLYFCEASVQFEATYFSSNVKFGEFLYHVAPKSIAHKILAKGLIPANKNNYGFNYGPRVYMFRDGYNEIAMNYAKTVIKPSKRFILNDKIAKNILNFYRQLEQKQNGILFDTYEFCLFKIDSAKIGNVKLYRDNTFDMNGDFVAVYSVDPIPPKAIEIAAEFTV